MKYSNRIPLFVRRILRGSNNANFYRLLRAGRISVGYATYGIPPEIRSYEFDNTRLEIGSYSSIAGGTTFVLGGQHPTDRVTTYPLRIMFDLLGKGADGFPYSKGDITVGSDVWIGHGVTVLSGVRIGNGAVIGAGSLVTKDIPDFAIAVGSPAIIKRFRFREAQRAALLDIAWWNWEPRAVLQAAPHLSDGDIDQFINWARARRSEVSNII